MYRRVGLAVLSLFLLTTWHVAYAEPPKIRVAVLKFGTVMWELETIKRYGLDTKNNYTLEIQPVANKQAAAVMLQAGETDAIVGDWFWAARQWQNRRFVVLPYSRAVGGVVVKDSNISSVADLKGRRIAVAGGPLDKNWLMLRAFAKKQYGYDLAEDADVVFASAPIVHQKMLAGEFDAAINFWHYLARAKVAGLHFLTTTKTLSQAADLDVEVPLLVYIFKQKWTDKNPQQLRAFAASSRAAKHLLRSDKTAWVSLKPRMKLRNEGDFNALRASFIAGIPANEGWPDLPVLQSWLSFLKNNGGSKLVGEAKTLVPEMFISGND